MKTIKFLFVTLAALIMTVGCDELGGLLGDGLKELELSKTTLEFEAEAGSQSIEITAPLAWEVKCSASWITVTPDKGEASTEKVKVTIAVAENTGEARDADVEFVIEKASQTLTVRQKAAEDDPGTPDVPGTPDETMKGWGVVGEVNGWGFNADGSTRPDIPMEVDESGKFLVAYKIEFPEGRFKLRQNGEWLETNGNVGLYQKEGLLEVDHVYDVVNSYDDARDMYIMAGTYDVWFDLANLKLYMMTAGKAVSEAVAGTPGEIPGTDVPDIPVEPEGTWGIVGEVNGWGATKDIPMELLKDSVFVARNVELPDGGFKIRKNNEWNDAANIGLEVRGEVKVDHVYPVVCGGGSGDMMIAAGTYDIYLDEKAMLVYIMTPGKDYAEATSPGDTPVVPPVDPTVWYIAGEFNNWTAGDENYKMTPGDEYYSFIGLSVDAETEFKFTLPNWAEDRGADQTLLNEAVALVPGGKNLVIPAGKYDLYLSNDLNTAYIMEHGLLPGEKPEVKENLAVDVEEITIPAAGGSVDVGFAATHDWKVSCDAEWVAVSPESGAGSADRQVVTVTALKNDAVARSAKILFEMGSQSHVVVVMQDAEEVVPEVPEYTWYLAGSFNGWVCAEEAYKMTVEGNFHVFKGLSVNEPAEFKFNIGNWDINRGGDFKEINVGFEVWDGAYNICIPAGTYDVYLTKDTNKAYVMEPGKTPQDYAGGLGTEDFTKGDIVEW